MIARYVKIKGRVQGVYYRMWLRSHAQPMNITGWVKNCSDGTVEALLQGSLQKINRLVELCREGSPSAHVIEIEEYDREVNSHFTSFEIKY